MTDYRAARWRFINHPNLTPSGDYVLYWMQIYRRLDHNHALDAALHWAVELRKSLVIYEGLKLGYPWASRRLHQFILEGMQANRAAAARLGLNYWPFVETPSQSGSGLLRRLAARACLVVTDDFPCFIIPDQTAALASKSETSVLAVDGNSIVPLSLLGPAPTAAAHLRRRIHKAFAEAWSQRAATRPRFPRVVRQPVEPPFALWETADLNAFLDCLPLGQGVRPVAETPGGTPAARARLKGFLNRRLSRYAENRSQPASPRDSHGSGLSPYLHFGHISMEEVAASVLATTGEWSPAQVCLKALGKRAGYYCDDSDVNAFLDEAITWRDVGFLWHWHRRRDTASLDQALPEWALATLRKHDRDGRAFVYSAEEWEAGETHDPLWNAAQKELVKTGTIHNYMRMLWGKKVIEWSASHAEAYRTLVHLNNKYALDGRNPNSWSGILWCFGLFDRPWGPERPVFGKVRYMSSESAARKFDLTGYLDYVRSL